MALPDIWAAAQGCEKRELPSCWVCFFFYFFFLLETQVDLCGSGSLHASELECFEAVCVHLALEWETCIPAHRREAQTVFIYILHLYKCTSGPQLAELQKGWYQNTASSSEMNDKMMLISAG